jgi:hypothetical protein
MGFLSRLFGGGGNRSSADRDGMYIYVRPKMCQEIVRVRVNLMNDLSSVDEGGYFVRKIVSATRCPFQAEVELHFDNKRKLKQSTVTNGDWLEEDDYVAWMREVHGTTDNED